MDNIFSVHLVKLMNNFCKSWTLRLYKAMSNSALTIRLVNLIYITIIIFFSIFYYYYHQICILWYDKYSFQIHHPSRTRSQANWSSFRGSCKKVTICLHKSFFFFFRLANMPRKRPPEKMMLQSVLLVIFSQSSMSVFSRVVWFEAKKPISG